MKSHVKLYLKAFGYAPGEYIASELTGAKAVDVHHIFRRGAGGTKEEDRIENLMALTREEHVKYGDKKQLMKFLYIKHRDFMDACGVKYDEEYMKELIDKAE